MRRVASRQLGFSMLELLVATAIMVIIVAISLSTLQQAFRANEGVALLADMTENLRAGMNYITRDVIQTGEGIPTGGIPIPYGTGLKTINRPSPVGTAYTFPSTYTTIPAVTPGPSLGPTVLRPTDMITVLYADNTYPLQQNPVVCPATNASCTPVCNGILKAPGGTLTITFDLTCANLSKETILIKAGDLVMLTNNQGSVLQTVTGVSIPANTLTFASGDAFNLNNNDNPGGSPQGTLGTIESPTFSGNFPVPTTATRIWMITYFLNTTIDPTRPMLLRQVNMNAPQIVAEVIEDLQITYDVVDGATNPSNVKQPAPPDTPAQIRKVNLFLAGRSEYLFSQSNSYFRNNLMTQVSLRSLAFVQQYH
jgi:prepilin-type N-terminal cleavage/methylation domain-containing protein